MVVVAGIGVQKVWFAHIRDMEEEGAADAGIAYYSAPRVRGVKQFDVALDQLLDWLEETEGTRQSQDAPGGFFRWHGHSAHDHDDYRANRRKGKAHDPDLWDGYIQRAIRRNTNQTARVDGPTRWRGQHVGAVATGFCSDGKKQKFAMIEAQTGMSIIRVEGLTEARTAGKRIEAYLEEHAELRQVLKEGGFGHSPDTFPSDEVREQFKGLRKAAEGGA